MADYSSDFGWKFFDPPQERVFRLDFFEVSAREGFGWIFLGSPQERVFLWKFFDPPQGTFLLTMLFVWVIALFVFCLFLW